MQLTFKGKTFSLIVVLSFIFSYLVTAFDHFPHFGISITLSLFTLLSYWLKKDKIKDTKIYFFFTMSFAILLAVRSEGFITAINLLATLFYGTLMIVSQNKNMAGVLDTSLGPVFLVVASFLTKSEYFLEQQLSKRNKKTKSYSETILGIVLTIILLAVILPLLSSTNPFFEGLVLDIYKVFNLEEILKGIDDETLFTWSLRLVSAFGFMYMIPKVLTFMNKTPRFSVSSMLDIFKISLTIPMFCIAIVLMVFFLTQLKFYTASNQTLSDIGYSLSEHSREVFGQLSVVALIIFALVYNNTIKSGIAKILSNTLVTEGIFLTFMAYKSVFEYIHTWGLTYKRLYGLVVATWVLGVFVLFVYAEIKRKSNHLLIKNFLVFTGGVLLIVNMVNFDYMIYHYHKASTGQGVDYRFLTTLSADSLSYNAQLENLLDAHAKSEEKNSFFHQNYSMDLIWKIQNLKTKYQHSDFRTWNLLDYLQYLQIKDVDDQKMIEIFQPLVYPPTPS